MPTPIEILLDPISLAVIGMYIGLMVWESLAPAQPLPYVRYWKIKGIISFFIYFYLSSYLPLFIDPLLEPLRLFDLSHWKVGVSAIFGLLVYEFGLYLWHWCMHEYDALWKSFHQMHHSAERIDTYGAFYFSPLDMIGFTLLGNICFTLLVSLNPQAITIFLLSATFLGMFQHANINTPRWLGYFIQRPESHALHHAKGIHRYNYSDLPIFDMLFGTFRNPRKFVKETGFYHGASDRIVDMLLFKDVSKPPVIQKETASTPALETATEEN